MATKTVLVMANTNLSFAGHGQVLEVPDEPRMRRAIANGYLTELKNDPRTTSTSVEPQQEETKEGKKEKDGS